MTFRDALLASPALFPLAREADAVQFVQLSESDYAQASFLDGRIVRPVLRSVWTPLRALEAAAPGLKPNCDFIFHISHCGSTLLSRLLGTHPQVFSLREPQILRHLAAEQFDLFLGLWSRTFHPQQRALIKATSFVSERALALLDSVPGSRAVLMFVPLQTFLPALLDGAMSDIDRETEPRRLRLEARLGQSVNAESPGERVAMSWLCEMLSLSQAAAKCAERVVWLDFDLFLQEPRQGLIRVFNHLRIDVADQFIQALVSSPLMTRYAKKTEVAYDTAFRERLLRQAEQKQGSEIQRGLDWFLRLADRHSGFTSLSQSHPYSAAR